MSCVNGLECCVYFLLSFFSYEKDDDEKDDLKGDKDVDLGKLDDDSWGASRGYRHGSRDGRQAPIPTFRAYSSEEFKQRDRECTVCSNNTAGSFGMGNSLSKTILQCILAGG